MTRSCVQKSQLTEFPMLVITCHVRCNCHYTYMDELNIHLNQSYHVSIHPFNTFLHVIPGDQKKRNKKKGTRKGGEKKKLFS